jgi:general stress protein YciG
MAGTRAGGAKAAQTNKLKYGEDFYSNIGKIGGTMSNTGGFYNNKELAREAGKKGGKISKRRKAGE